jgi:hypothetical protein
MPCGDWTTAFAGVTTRHFHSRFLGFQRLAAPFRSTGRLSGNQHLRIVYGVPDLRDRL